MNKHNRDEELTAEIPAHARWQEYCRTRCLRFFSVTFSSADFQRVLDVRSTVYGSADASRPDTIDVYSEHYLCFRDEEPVSAVRVTRHSVGPLDCQEFFPQCVLSRWGDKIGSATRFVALPEVQATTKIAQLTVEAAWTDQLARGIRMDVINVHERAVKYYGKLGYELVARSFFVHPKWNTPSHVMLFPATPNRESPIRSLFYGIDEPIEMEQLRNAVNIFPWRTFSRCATVGEEGA